MVGCFVIALQLLLIFTAITPSSAPSLKRRAPSPENSDSENVDPSLLDIAGKRKRSAFGDDDSLSKRSRLSLDTLSKPRPFQIDSTPRLDTVIKSITPISAPPAAGRSPTKPKRQLLAQPRKRFAPPAFGIKSPAVSIGAALSGTLANKKPRKVRTIEESKSKSWFFDIYEEPEQVQNDRMNEWTLSQSAACMDVSDDESKSREHTDRGKENIDPNEIAAPMTRSMAAAKAAAEDLKKDLMTDDRSPLGDLNPANFYAEGLDATSVVLVQEDTSQEKETKPAPNEGQPSVSNADFTFASSEMPRPETDLSTDDISAVILSSIPKWEHASEHSLSQEPTQDELALQTSDDLEIWESESAKG